MKQSFFLCLTAVFSLILVATGPATAKIDPPEPRPFDTILSKVVATLISTQHYTKKPLNDQVSQQLFNEFFATLDRDRRFFLASDIDEFSSYRNALDNQLFAGNLEFAFKVYDRFLQRVDERMSFARKRLAEPFDFTLDEELVLDRSDSPWAETKEELDEIWRKQLKNRVLVYTLMQEQADKEKAEQSETDEAEHEAEAAVGDADEAGEDADIEEAAPFVQKDPVERVLDAQERFLSYIKENESIDVLEMYLSSLTHIYDPHSNYMAPMTEEDFDINMKLSLEGIGAMLTTEDGYVKITELVDGGPADLDGRLKPGDRIVAVAQRDEDPVDVVDMPLRKVVRLIRGKKGSVVFLSIIEAGKSLASVPTTIDIVRDEVKLTEKSAKSEIKTIQLPPVTRNEKELPVGEAKIMVIKLPSFYCDFDGRRQGKKDYRSASRDVRKLLEEGKKEGIDGVILDLRSNGGGSLDEAIELAGLFFPEGPVVQVKAAGNQRKVHEDKDGETVYAGPLAILVNRMSASASEIVAAAIQDHHRGVIIGDASTHGKGTVQTVYDLTPLFRRDPVFRNEKTGSLKFTIAKFYRVNGESTQRRGVLPDITFSAFTDHMEIGEASLDHALRWDHIQALDQSDEIDITPYLLTLKDRSEHRVEADEAFQKHNESIARYGELRNRKTTPLNIDVRRGLLAEEKEWIEEIRTQTFGEPTTEDETENGEEEKNAKDLVMDESLRITGDLIWLQQGDLVALPKTGKPSDPTLSGTNEN